ncbi:hypothetical protein OPT61_g5778 [Boeremia exigua]|uniref:Uncharacterized protein n=1 Tax=Boeremia exigua TaxID=749465 RepID=A0ACC2I985_9PLEO|nr:hypothetical protein OPT61_g5778 [Boeremia exigua]
MLSCGKDPGKCAIFAGGIGEVMIGLEEANADKAHVLLQAQAATSQRPNHTRQGVCKTQAENVFAVGLTEAAGSRMNNETDPSQAGMMRLYA